LSEKGNSFLRLLKNKGFREESMTKVGLYAIGTSTTLESNKSLGHLLAGVHIQEEHRLRPARGDSPTVSGGFSRPD